MTTNTGSTLDTSLADAAKPGPAPLRLAAMDTDDLAILSANLQDTEVTVADMAYLPAQRRFALAGKRFDWIKAASGTCQRCATGLHFDCVLGVARTGFVQDEAGRVLNLLALNFDTTEAPAGTVSLTFSGGAAVRLTVECLEAQMRDLGECWPCDCQPVHD